MFIDTFKQTADRIAFLDRGVGIDKPDVQSAIETIYLSTPKARMFNRSSFREPLFNFMLKERLIVKGKGDWYNRTRENGNLIQMNNGDLAYFISGIIDETYKGDNVYIGVSISEDNGLTWSNPVKLNGLLPSEDPFCVIHNDTYYLYVEDKSITPFKDIRLYTSQDLVTWEDKGPVLNPSPEEWDSQDVSSPTIIIENGTWYMFYEGRGSGLYDHPGAIGLATSSDGITWSKDENNPIITSFGMGMRFHKPPTVAFGRAIVPNDILKVNNRYFMTAHIGILNQWHSVLLGSEELDSDWVFLSKIYQSEPSNETVMFHWMDQSLICADIIDSSLHIYRPGVI